MEIVNDYMFEKAPHAKKYPWDKWFDGQKRRILRGKEFDCTAEAFRATATLAASRRGFLLRVSVIHGQPDAVVFQSYTPSEEQEQP